MVTPLTRTDKNDQALRRPPEIEAEIAEAADWGLDALLARASIPESQAQSLSSECLVYLIRADLDVPGTPAAELLLPILLARCAANLNRTVRGFREPTLSNIREEILGQLVLILVERGDKADFFEVRFGLALARLRIDFCHKYKRGEDHLVFPDDDPARPDDEPAQGEDACTLGAAPLDPEEALILKQALSRLDDEERKVLLLHRLAGVPINAGPHSLVQILGCSERTVRNRLRSAEHTLAAYKERCR